MKDGLSVNIRKNARKSHILSRVGVKYSPIHQGACNYAILLTALTVICAVDLVPRFFRRTSQRAFSGLRGRSPISRHKFLSGSCGSLNDCWEDRRLFEIWAEYFTAVQIKERNPHWEIQVSPNIRDDIVCNIKKGEERVKIKVQVKSGKCQKWTWDELELIVADACFTPFQIENADSFQYAVFLIHEDYKKIREVSVFSRDELKEVIKRRGNRASPYFISRVESLEVLKKWFKKYDPPEPLYELERCLVEKPEMYLERWDKIK